MYIIMDNQEKVLTGAQFRQYVHISTRKMKYLMDNNIVPHLNTGQATHKYEIKQSDADEFLRKVKDDPEFMSESIGIFSSRFNHPQRTNHVDDTFQEMAVQYFENRWKDQPEVLTTEIGGELLGTDRQYIRRAFEAGKLNAVVYRGLITFTKEELIAFVCRKDRLAHPPTMMLKDIITGLAKKKNR